MKFVHTKCGGEVIGHKCTKCKKEWKFGTHLTTLEIRPMPVSREDRKNKLLSRPPKPVTTYANWADSVPLVSTVAKMLPNWPRKWRIVAFVIFYGLVGTGVVFWIQSC